MEWEQLSQRQWVSTNSSRPRLVVTRPPLHRYISNRSKTHILHVSKYLSLTSTRCFFCENIDFSHFLELEITYHQHTDDILVHTRDTLSFNCLCGGILEKRGMHSSSQFTRGYKCGSSCNHPHQICSHVTDLATPLKITAYFFFFFFLNPTFCLNHCSPIQVLCMI